MLFNFGESPWLFFTIVTIYELRNKYNYGKQNCRILVLFEITGIYCNRNEIISNQNYKKKFLERSILIKSSIIKL